jgi:hypothetical protein
MADPPNNIPDYIAQLRAAKTGPGTPAGPSSDPSSRWMRMTPRPRDPSAMQNLITRGMTMLAGHAPGVAAGIGNDMTGLGEKIRNRVTTFASAGTFTPEAIDAFRTGLRSDISGAFPNRPPGSRPPGGGPPGIFRPRPTPEQRAAFRTARQGARTAARKTYTDAMTAYRASLKKPTTP